MSLELEQLQTQLASTETELEQAKAHVYRCDGALQMLKHMIAQIKAATSQEEPPKD